MSVAGILPLRLLKKLKKRGRQGRGGLLGLLKKRGRRGLLVIDVSAGEYIRLPNGDIVSRDEILSVDPSTGEILYIDPVTRRIKIARLPRNVDRVSARQTGQGGGRDAGEGAPWYTV